MMSDINTVQFFNKNINTKWNNEFSLENNNYMYLYFIKDLQRGRFTYKIYNGWGVILQNNFIRTNVVMIMVIWIKLADIKHYTTHLLTSDSSRGHVQVNFRYWILFFLINQPDSFIFAINQSESFIFVINQSESFIFAINKSESFIFAINQSESFIFAMW